MRPLARPTPFELVVPVIGESALDEIRAAARETATDITDPARFVRQPRVQQVLRNFGPAAGKANPREVIEQINLLYSLYRYWDAGQRVHRMRHAFNEAQAVSVAERSTLCIPGGACYVQLPMRWAWSQVDANTSHEPMDGIFASEILEAQQVLLVAVLGMHPERDGFSQVSTSVAGGDLHSALGLARRPLFAPMMDGGDRAGFKSINSPAELLLLTHVALAIPLE